MPGSKNINVGNAEGPNIRPIKAEYPGGIGTEERRSTPKCSFWSWTFYQLLTHTCLRDAGEKFRLCLSTSAGLSTIDATQTLNPCTIFGCELRPNLYEMRLTFSLQTYVNEVLSVQSNFCAQKLCHRVRFLQKAILYPCNTNRNVWQQSQQHRRPSITLTDFARW